MDKEDLEAIAEMAKEHDILVLSDEMYRDIVYDSTHTSIAELPGMLERSIILDGFSKTYAMTGWRLGYGVFPPELVPHISKLMVNSVSCTAPFVQKAGVAALEGSKEEPQGMVAEFRRRRDMTCDALNEIDGIRCFQARRGVLLVPQRFGPRTFSATVRGPIAIRERGGGASGHLLRGIRRGIRADFLRHEHGESGEGRGGDTEVRGEALGVSPSTTTGNDQ